MYIEEVILEGFKSYGTRTSINGWDPEFNAITGLNGTGKSNILDAICFVLGIDNLKQVRAATLQDLVYKKGQAGVTKASVTIIFNNLDAKKSPIGYEQCAQVTVTRQIILNGKNKYLINGHNAQQKAVENLFQSVQLNVNNPHFLIMQGQITRVLNMKPVETLALIEESAGTRMFEDRKGKAIGTLEKKDRKVEEIAALIADTIEPKLDSLKSERSDFLEYKRVESEVEKMQRLLKAHNYARDIKGLKAEEEKVLSTKEELSEAIQQNKRAKLDLENIVDEILTVTKRKEKESKANAKLRDLEEACKEAASSMVRLQTQVDFKTDNLVSEEKVLNKLQEEILNEQSKVESLAKTVSKIETKYKASEETRQKMVFELKRDEDLFRSLETGISGDGSSETGYTKLLKDARDKQSSTQTAMQQNQQKIKHLTSELQSMEKEYKVAQKETKSSSDRIGRLQEEMRILAEKLSSVTINNKVDNGIVREHHQTRKALSEMQEEFDLLQSAASGVEFRYTKPTNNFDESKVKGMVAKLVKLASSEALKYSTALEVAAGGRLYNIVVEDDKTAANLLDGGRLGRRTTFIPLNKIQAKVIAADKVRLASDLTSGQAKLGISLLDINSNIAKAMEYVFGNTFICDSKEAASTVAFDKRLGFRAVTIEGDVYEPYGTLSGGSAPQTGGTLLKLYKYTAMLAERDRLEQRLANLDMQIQQQEGERHRQMEIETTLGSKEQELETLKRQFSLNAAGQLLERHQAMTEELRIANEQVQEQQKIVTTLEEEANRLCKELAELDGNREGKLAEIKKQIEKTKTFLAKDESNFKKLCDEYLKLKNDHDASINLIEETKEKANQVKNGIQQTEKEVEQLNNENFEIMTVHNGLRVRLDNEARNLRQFDTELMALDEKKQRLEKSTDAFALERKQLEDAISNSEKILAKIQDRLSTLLKSDPWIQDHLPSFGVADGPFDFAKHNMTELASRLKGMETQLESLRKRINFNVINMLDRVEAKDGSLKQMLATVKKDKTKIEGTIEKLNDYMLDALNKTWKKVSLDFGQIFGELLPGSTARLDLIEDEPITSGLEIKVCLGGVWKESLTELSGGQRSLVALSLILSLLQYKPAPMYILDEVDAALDLSHTENIGTLLKTRFKGSQFIVVSLKEGMFANANVIFRTRFQNGMSTVERNAGNIKMTTIEENKSSTRESTKIKKQQITERSRQSNNNNNNKVTTKV